MGAMERMTSLPARRSSLSRKKTAMRMHRARTRSSEPPGPERDANGWPNGVLGLVDHVA